MDGLRAEMELVDEFLLTGLPRGSVGRGLDPVPPPAVDVPVGAGEAVAALVEVGGALVWRFAEGSAGTAGRGGAAGPASRRGPIAGSAMTILLDDVPAVDPPPDRAATRAVPGLGMLRDRVLVRVLRFVVDPAVGGLAAVLERGRGAGLVRIADPDPALWERVAPPSLTAATSGGRVLVLVHGTFSSTVGGFGPLGRTEHGRRWLTDAIQSYDAVVGFDHRTLSVAPEDNAARLAALVQELGPSRLDVVAHGRGGLVARLLVEEQLDPGGDAPVVDGLVLLGATNRGTEFARPANWHRLADTVTNLSVATIGAIGTALAPGAGAAAVAGAVGTGLSVFVRALAAGVAEPDAVPGIAAMAPGSDLLARLDRGDHAPLHDRRLVIGATFDPTIPRRPSGGGRSAEDVLLWVADRVADTLVGVDSDLMVDTASALHPGTGRRDGAIEIVHVPPTSGVHHLAYLEDEDVMARVGAWLGIAAGGGTRAPVPTPPRARGPSPPPPSRPPPGSAGVPGVPLGGPSSGNGGPATASTPPRHPPAADGGTPTSYEVGARLESPIVVETPVTLEVALAAGALQLDAPGSVSGTASIEIDHELPVVCDVLPRRDVRLIDPGRFELVPPRAGDRPARAYVSLLATGIGVAQVDVVARQGNAPLAMLSLRPVVVDASAHDGHGTVVAAATAQPPEPLTRTPHRLTVWRGDVEGRVRFEAILESSLLDQSRRFVGPPLPADVDEHLVGLRMRIEDADDWTHAGQELVDEIRGHGVELFHSLLHEDLRGWLWENRRELAGLQIRTNDPSVPWELVHLDGPDGRLPKRSWFLADLGVVRWLEHLEQPFPPPDLVVATAAAVAPEYPAGSGWELPAVADEIGALARMVPLARVEATRAAVVAALDGDFDLLHYAGHGTAAPGPGLDAELILGLRPRPGGWAKETLPALSVRQVRFADGRRPVVVLNACQVGRGQQRISGLGGFAEAFLGAGAGVLVAPLWSVGDRPAAAFVECFYERLRAGDDVSAASAAARRHARGQGELSWLAYSVYANPETRVVIGPTPAPP